MQEFIKFGQFGITVWRSLNKIKSLKRFNMFAYCLRSAVDDFSKVSSLYRAVNTKMVYDCREYWLMIESMFFLLSLL